MSLSIFDNHTLYVRFDVATEAQILQCFMDACATYKRTYDATLECRVRVNLVQDHQGKTFGFAFVFVTNSAVYHMLLGKNPDGTDRIQYLNDPTWVPPSNPQEEVDRSIDNSSNFYGWASLNDQGRLWADIVEEEEEAQRQRELVLQAYICPKIKIQLDPLMVLPPIKLTPQQIETKKLKIISCNENKSDFDPNLITIQELLYLNIDRAAAKPVEPKYMPNILRCTNVPFWVTPADLKMQFKPYATDSETIHDRCIKGRRMQEAYPFININAENIAFIIFDPSTYDAYFALHMMKKTIITKLNNQGSHNTVTLIFTHSFRTDRDIMTTITQSPRIYHTPGPTSSPELSQQPPKSRKGDESDKRNNSNRRHGANNDKKQGSNKNNDRKRDDGRHTQKKEVQAVNFFGSLKSE